MMVNYSAQSSIPTVITGPDPVICSGTVLEQMAWAERNYKEIRMVDAT
jgi:hypothetical protein